MCLLIYGKNIIFLINPKCKFKFGKFEFKFGKKKPQI